MKLFGISREDVEAQTGLTISQGGITQTGTAAPTAHGLKLGGSSSPRCATPNNEYPPGSSRDKPIFHLSLSPISDPAPASEEEATRLLCSKSETNDALELTPLDKGKSTGEESNDAHLHTIKMEESGSDGAESIEL